MSDKIANALDNLRIHQRQLDADGCEVGVSRQALNEVIASHGGLQIALEAAERALAERAGGVKVKALDWQSKQHGSDVFADCEVGRYECGKVRNVYMAFLRAVTGNGTDDIQVFAGVALSAAKAAAQADYERRTLSALTTEPAAPHPLAKRLPDHETLRGQIEGDPDDAYEGAGAARPEGRQEAVAWQPAWREWWSDKEPSRWLTKEGVSSDAFEAGFKAATRPAEQAEPVAWIEREALAELQKHKNADAVVCSGLLSAPFGDKVALYTSPPDQSADLAAGRAEVAEAKALLAEVENFARAAATWRDVPPSIADAARTLLEKMGRP